MSKYIFYDMYDNVTSLEIFYYNKTLNTIKLYWQYFHVIGLSKRNNKQNAMRYIDWWSQKHPYFILLGQSMRDLYYDANCCMFIVGCLWHAYIVNLYGPQFFYSPWSLGVSFLSQGQDQSHWILFSLYIWKYYYINFK